MKRLGVDIVTIILVIFFVVIFVIGYYKINKYLRFVNEFVSVEEIDLQKLNKNILEILFCTKEQLKNNCKLILKFYADNKSNANTESLKIVGDEESFNTEKCLEFFKMYNIDHIPNMLFLENGTMMDYIVVTREV